MTALARDIGTNPPPAIEGFVRPDEFVVLRPIINPEPDPVGGKGRLTPVNSVIPLHTSKERVKARFRLLKRLQQNHDGEGAEAPISDTVDMAIAFIDTIDRHPDFFATLDDDGCAVIECRNRDTGFFADLTFRSDGTVEAYRRETGKPSLEYVGILGTPDMNAFLDQELHVTLL